MPQLTGETQLLAHGFTEDDILMCQHVMAVLANADTDDPYSGDIELFGEDDQGRETFGLYSIQEYAAKTAAILGVVTAAPVVEQEPVAWLWGSSNSTTDKEMAEGFEQRTPGSTKPLYLHPQPAPDVTALVEALEYISKKSWDALKMTDNRAGRAKDEILCGYAEHIIQSCDAALAIYRKLQEPTTEQERRNSERLAKLDAYYERYGYHENWPEHAKALQAEQDEFEAQYR